MSDRTFQAPRSACAFALACAVMLLSACSGHLYTVENPTPVSTPSGLKYQGIPVYAQLNVIELYQLRAHVEDKTGKLLGTAAENTCVPMLKQVFSVRTDYSKRMFVRYEPGAFDSSKFALKLKDGALESVNADSDSTAGLKNLASILPFVTPPYGEKTPSDSASIAAADGADGKPKPDADSAKKKLACNAEPKLIGLYEAPGVRSFDDLVQAIADAEKGSKGKTEDQGGNPGANKGAGNPGMPRATQ